MHTGEAECLDSRFPYQEGYSWQANVEQHSSIFATKVDVFDGGSEGGFHLNSDPVSFGLASADADKGGHF